MRLIKTHENKKQVFMRLFCVQKLQIVLRCGIHNYKKLNNKATQIIAISSFSHAKINTYSFATICSYENLLLAISSFSHLRFLQYFPNTASISINVIAHYVELFSLSYHITFSLQMINPYSSLYRAFFTHMQQNKQ